jgi:hypothetical protein
MNINIIKSLLFIIVLIFIYEAYKNILKIKEMGHMYVENFSCQSEKLKKNNPFLVNIEEDNSTEYSSFKPYRPDYPMYGNRLYSYQEGQYRNNMDKLNIERIKNILMRNKNLSEHQRDKLKEELKLEEWRSYLFKQKKNDNTPRLENDIRTDYDPDIGGCQRLWHECGSRNQIYKYYKNPESYNNYTKNTQY